METRVALIAVAVSNFDAVEQVNRLLHEYGEFIIGRMGIPYKKDNISLISIAIDAPEDSINALTGKLGSIPGISTKTVYPVKNK